MPRFDTAPDRGDAGFVRKPAVEPTPERETRYIVNTSFARFVVSRYPAQLQAVLTIR